MPVPAIRRVPHLTQDQQLIQPIPSASYRIQLRDGVTFAHVEAQLDYLRTLGISHLYLSPIFRAPEGSTHGYDVLDPGVVDPVLGGLSGFERLAVAAHRAGLGIILDIVPNHTAFTLENDWLGDVLKHGEQSRHAPLFDIDWEAGPLILPLLPDPFGVMLERGDFAAADGYWHFPGMQVPLSPDGPQSAASNEDLVALHERQNWRLRHWEAERDSITHRRFFNITSLIGMRVEDPAVFDATHGLVIDLVRRGFVDGLRVDHIDGLADPKAYLDRLAEALPGTPVWIEKILVGEEELDPRWKTAGTTGYEAGRRIAQLLTDAAGLAVLDPIWRGYTGIEGDFPKALEAAKLDVLHNELAAERHQLIGLASIALGADPAVEAGPESLDEAVTQLLLGMPRYRTHIDADGATETDRRLIADLVRDAEKNLRSSRTIERLAQHLAKPDSAADRRFVTRFQQVSGALLAKAQEDTAGFRWTGYLAANEVGAEPGEPNITEAEANRFLADRRPSAMTLTSSHDTKRSEDSRMRLVAISHHPEAFDGLAREADRLAPDLLPRRWRWYIVQSALALWDEQTDRLEERLRQHNGKALREAKLESFWTKPNPDIERAADRFSDALCAGWRSAPPEALRTIIATGAALSLAQLALKCLMPGFPDFYRGSEGPFLALTDPDNRLPVNWQDLAHLAQKDGFAGDKARLTRLLLGLRKDEAAFFENARTAVRRDGMVMLRRWTDQRGLTVTLGGPGDANSIWQSGAGRQRLTIGWH